MGLRDRITDAIGGVIGGGLELITDSLAKANAPTGKTDGTAAMVQKMDRATLPPEPTKDDPKALLVDPFAMVDQLGFRERPSALTYQTLRQMARRVPTFTAILQTRINQVASFAQRQKDKGDPGIGIVLRDHKKTPTRQDQKRMRYLEDFMLQTGSSRAPGRDGLRHFLRKIVRDTLELDQVGIEIQRNRKGDPCAFYALDGGTLRLVDVPPNAQSQEDPTRVRYVQIYDEVPISEFAAHELIFGVRNPRTDIAANGYGYSELEMLINVITASLWSFEYNKKVFSNGSLVNGVMNFKGSVPDRKVDAFRRQWKMMMTGVDNSHRIPMTNVDELQFIDLGKTNRDMEYGAWMDWLIKITCAVMQFDPAEINFSYGNTGQTSQMFSTPVDDKLKASKDRGLKPLLSDIAEWINTHIIWPLDPYFEFAFLGLDAETSSEALDRGKKQSEYLLTVDELRAQQDLEPMSDGKGEVILNTVWLQAAQAKDAMAQQAEQGGMGADGGMFGDGGDGEQESPGVESVAQGGGDEPPNGGDFDFDSLFPPGQQQKSLTVEDQLRKSRVRVYDIEL